MLRPDGRGVGAKGAPVDINISEAAPKVMLLAVGVWGMGGEGGWGGWGGWEKGEDGGDGRKGLGDRGQIFGLWHNPNHVNIC